MVDASTFNLQPNFPIAGVADLYANRSFKEAQMRAQQQQQLVQGLQQFGQGVDSLVQRRMQMAQALASANMFSRTPEGQQMLGTNQVTSTPASSMPVTQNQTANYNPATGTVTPNQSQVGINDIATSMFGMAPKDVFENMQKSKALSYEPQKIAIEGRKATAEEENNKIQRLIQGMLAKNTIENQAKERKQAEENSRFTANKEIASHWIAHPFAAAAARDAMLNQGSGTTQGDVLPAVGKTITHSSGVKITRTK